MVKNHYDYGFNISYNCKILYKYMKELNKTKIKIRYTDNNKFIVLSFNNEKLNDKITSIINGINEAIKKKFIPETYLKLEIPYIVNLTDNAYISFNKTNNCISLYKNEKNIGVSTLSNDNEFLKVVYNILSTFKCIIKEEDPKEVNYNKELKETEKDNECKHPATNTANLLDVYKKFTLSVYDVINQFNPQKDVDLDKTLKEVIDKLLERKINNLIRIHVNRYIYERELINIFVEYFNNKLKIGLYINNAMKDIILNECCYNIGYYDDNSYYFVQNKVSDFGK